MTDDLALRLEQSLREARRSRMHPPEDPYGLDQLHGPLDDPDALARLYRRLKAHGREPVSTVRFLERRGEYRADMEAMLSEERQQRGSAA